MVPDPPWSERYCPPVDDEATTPPLQSLPPEIFPEFPSVKRNFTAFLYFEVF